MNDRTDIALIAKYVAILFFLPLCCTGCMFWPHYETIRTGIDGVVLDAESQKPIQNALVVDATFKQVDMTGDNGRFRLDEVTEFWWCVHLADVKHDHGPLYFAHPKYRTRIIDAFEQIPDTIELKKDGSSR